MSRTKQVFAGLGIFVGMLVLTFVLGLYGLGWKKFFKPKHENVERQVFEQTQSYVHGKIQELAKYRLEYYKLEDIKDKEAMRQVIIDRFAEFDKSKIRSSELQNFLTQMRGY